jgi:hypothetical protein
MSYKRVRSTCEFSVCRCLVHRYIYNINGIETCANCGHGSCWHKLVDSSKSQFVSSRSCTRTPIYSFYDNMGNIPVYVFTPEIQLPIAIAVPVYCSSLELLPI